ncbi:MAG: adenylosuccinate synthase [Bacilli bacterium]|nr:adenylosuccinate synthase [Bacilli bacterium]MBN2696694.1 adenylosuccinate synthase [Bacilli bacterium]
MARTVVVVGTQWGDEGKGKITDYLAWKADVVVRSQGGNNAGHSIFFANKKYALHLIPSGVFNPKATNVMANGMVINPEALTEELDMLNKSGLKQPNLLISDRAHVVMPYHLIMDELQEELKQTDAIGTTKKGIGPAYADKASRIGIRFGDLTDKDGLTNKINLALKYYNPIFKAFGKPELKVEDLVNRSYAYGEKFRDNTIDTSIFLNEAIDKNKAILFEGAQGTMLCLDHGTYPYVTSSSPTAASVPLATGIAPRYIDEVIGVTKAYTTRVGSGSFPTEFENETTKYIRERGHEYGTTTGRPRRIGWLDINILNHAVRINGITGIAIMLLDVLTGIDEIKICTGYVLDGKKIHHIPGSYSDFSRCKPIYETYPGWKEDISQIKDVKDLPKNCINYLKQIERMTNTKITLVSVGPDREQTIILYKYFE